LGEFDLFPHADAAVADSQSERLVERRPVGLFDSFEEVV
jgi:hypothetical protein